MSKSQDPPAPPPAYFHTNRLHSYPFHPLVPLPCVEVNARYYSIHYSTSLLDTSQSMQRVLSIISHLSLLKTQSGVVFKTRSYVFTILLFWLKFAPISPQYTLSPCSCDFSLSPFSVLSLFVVLTRLAQSQTSVFFLRSRMQELRAVCPRRSRCVQ